MSNNIVMGSNAANKAKVPKPINIGNMINMGIIAPTVNRSRNNLQYNVANAPTVRALGMNIPSASVQKRGCGCGR